MRARIAQLAILFALSFAPVTAAEPLLLEMVENAKVVDTGRAGMPAFLADPGVIADESGYHLFVTNHVCDRDGDGAFDGDEYLFDPETTVERCFDPDGPRHRQGAAIFYAHSDDEGRTWRFRPLPALAPEAGTYDSEKVETAFPVVIDGALHLFYSATGHHGEAGFVPARYAIGAAKVHLAGRTIRQALMRDNAVFEKVRETPVLDYVADARAYGNSVQEPSVVVRRDGAVELYYTALRLKDPRSGTGDDLDGIALMRATFADTRLADPEIETVNALDLANLPWSLDLRAASLPLNIQEVYHDDGGYHAFYTTLGDGEFHRDQEIRYAWSDDGLRWRKGRTLVTHDQPFSEWGVMAPSVIFAGDHLDVFYTAFGEVSDQSCIPQGDAARWGTPIKDGKACLHAMVGRARFRIGG
ncbi:hypothetical protein [Oricola sp.]|uniref:hypothetical protein n=1 Tax=Oricola sp. TaxID=1979950 RepID=UPI0025CF056D|nr:hypothetical protein [Oricola sp.]MCI5074405.1 hypothetical protein [Oricola sp.]